MRHRSRATQEGEGVPAGPARGPRLDEPNLSQAHARRSHVGRRHAFLREITGVSADGSQKRGFCQLRAVGRSALTFRSRLHGLSARGVRAAQLNRSPRRTLQSNPCRR
jgi:hypothetical protein